MKKQSYKLPQAHQRKSQVNSFLKTLSCFCKKGENFEEIQTKIWKLSVLWSHRNTLVIEQSDVPWNELNPTFSGKKTQEKESPATCDFDFYIIKEQIVEARARARELDEIMRKRKQKGKKIDGVSKFHIRKLKNGMSTGAKKKRNFADSERLRKMIIK